ncbi:UNVERIFIED_CONTAM: metallophosphoesterase [Streptococcus canis]|uniref:Metallophosphoesterase n=1 Tax=Streptococcus canis TaxID=1329 RepID=A0AAE4Q7N2_STRCB|nr:metallophosphoesterase [Streptococcus canis]MDV5977542.1 metallophosphoesterase [Streptococcus canis]
MTRLAIMSDLHLDLNHFGPFERNTLIELLKHEKIDHLHLAGDMANHFYQDTEPFLAALANEVTVTFNLGNHDMLDVAEADIETLDFKTYALNPSTTLLAFHGWYDYGFSEEMADADYVAFKNRFWFDRRLKRPLTDPELTKEICQTLEKTLAALSDQTLIVAMHFVPHSIFTLKHPKVKAFNAFLGSPAFHDIFRRYGVKEVVFGHNHKRFSPQTIDGVTYQSRPLGYTKEWQLTRAFIQKNPPTTIRGNWTPNKAYHAIKDLATFKAYQTEHLATELRDAMIIFDIDDERTIP